MILICYDGSPDSRCAATEAGRLLAGQPATVLTVWEPFIDVLARTPSGFGLGPGMVDSESIDKAAEASAWERAREGAGLAAEAGVEASPRTCTMTTSVADAILSVAEELNADAIMMGTRGLTGLKSVLLGSVSHGIIQHADRTVILVPSGELSEARRRHRHHER